jgi:hypothetical protein
MFQSGRHAQFAIERALRCAFYFFAFESAFCHILSSSVMFQSGRHAQFAIERALRRALLFGDLKCHRTKKIGTKVWHLQGATEMKKKRKKLMKLSYSLYSDFGIGHIVQFETERARKRAFLISRRG